MVLIHIFLSSFYLLVCLLQLHDRLRFMSCHELIMHSCIHNFCFSIDWLHFMSRHASWPCISAVTYSASKQRGSFISSATFSPWPTTTTWINFQRTHIVTVLELHDGNWLAFSDGVLPNVLHYHLHHLPNHLFHPPFQSHSTTSSQPRTR